MLIKLLIKSFVQSWHITNLDKFWALFFKDNFLQIVIHISTYKLRNISPHSVFSTCRLYLWLYWHSQDDSSRLLFIEFLSILQNVSGRLPRHQIVNMYYILHKNTWGLLNCWVVSRRKDEACLCFFPEWSSTTRDV